MRSTFFTTRLSVIFSALLFLSLPASGQKMAKSNASDAQFGPVMRAYLGYLRNEQEVVDDRVSRREISPTYYRRNSERIRALRQMAIRLVNESKNDYVPELEAVTNDEFGILFEEPPRPATLRPNQVLTNKFRYIGSINVGEVFYLFARLDPYEQAALMEQQSKNATPKSGSVVTTSATGQPVGQSATRQRRAVPR